MSVKPITATDAPGALFDRATHYAAEVMKEAATMTGVAAAVDGDDLVRAFMVGFSAGAESGVDAGKRTRTSYPARVRVRK